MPTGLCPAAYTPRPTFGIDTGAGRVHTSGACVLRRCQRRIRSAAIIRPQRHRRRRIIAHVHRIDRAERHR